MLFGAIVDDRVELSPAGMAVEAAWVAAEARWDVELDTYVVMPNHLHGVIHLLPTRKHSGRTLGVVIAGVKSDSARAINARRNSLGVAVWQRGYHEHVLRGEHELQRIRHYIAANPARWRNDRENPRSL
jgi:REP element-mobilizing transposase RayT